MRRGAGYSDIYSDTGRNALICSERSTIYSDSRGGRHLEFKRAEADPRFVAQYQATQDPSNRQRLKRDMLEDAVQGSRDESLDFYRLWATDEAFRKTFTQLFDRALEGGQQLSADL